MPEGATGAGALCFDRYLDLKAKTNLHRGRRGILDDATRSMAGEQQNLLYAMAPQFEQQHIEKRDAIDLEQWAYRVCWQRARPAPEATAQDRSLADHRRFAMSGLSIRGNRRRRLTSLQLMRSILTQNASQTMPYQSRSLRQTSCQRPPIGGRLKQLVNAVGGNARSPQFFHRSTNHREFPR